MKAASVLLIAILSSFMTQVWSSCICTCPLCPGVNTTQQITENECKNFCADANCGANNYDHSCKSSDDCLTGKTLLYSCDRQEAVEAKDVIVGEALQVLDKEHNKVCSEVYYVYHHDEPKEEAHDDNSYNVIKLILEKEDENEMGGDMEVEVSPNHLVYTVNPDGGHKAVRAKLVQPGDEVLMSKNNKKKAVVLSAEKIQSKTPELTNVLTFEPSLVLHNGVVVSAYSYDESWYEALFAPLRFAYRNFGAEAVEALIPTIRALEQSAVGNYALNWVASE